MTTVFDEIKDYIVIPKTRRASGGLIPIQAPTELLPGGKDDNESSNTAIGFDFPYADADYPYFYVSSNGFVGLSLESGSTRFTGHTHKPWVFFEVTAGSTQVGEAIILCPWWGDLETMSTDAIPTPDPHDGYVNYELQTLPDGQQRLVVEWYVKFFYGVPPYYYSKFQVVLWDNGNIEYRYDDLQTEPLSGTSWPVAYFNTAKATVGFKVDTTSTVEDNIRSFGWFAVETTGSGDPIGSDAPGVTKLSASYYPGNAINDSGAFGATEPYNIFIYRDITNEVIWGSGIKVSSLALTGDYAITKYDNLSSEMESRFYGEIDGDVKYTLSQFSGSGSTFLPCRQPPFSYGTNTVASIRERNTAYKVTKG